MISRPCPEKSVQRKPPVIRRLFHVLGSALTAGIAQRPRRILGLHCGRICPPLQRVTGVAKLPSDKKSKGRRAGLKQLEKLQPHVYGTDWRKKQEYTQWRFRWNLPLFGGRLPSPSWFAARLCEIYRFFVPRLLLVIVAVIGWFLWTGRPVPLWLWISLAPVIFELPGLVRGLVEHWKDITKLTLELILQVLAIPIYLFIMLITWLRMK